MDATKAADCSSIIKAFEKHMLSAPSEASIVGATIPKLAAIHSNAVSAANGLRNLVSPPIPSEVLSSFNNDANTGNEPAITIPDPFSQLVTKNVDIKNWQEWLKECIPCDLRVEFRAELIGKLDDQLLDILEEMINQYLKQISFILNLLNATDVYADVCPLLFAMRDICIPDLQRIISLLASILYRMSVKELSSIDLMKLIVLPIFQPIFNGLLGILNQYKVLITDPLTCVSANLNSQLGKLKTGSAVNQTLVNDLVEKTTALGLVSGEAQRSQLRTQLNNARQPFENIDKGIEAMQEATGSAVFHLHRLMQVGIFEIEALLDELRSEFASFLNINDKESVEFLLNQYQKLLIFRLIEFIAALIKALTVGFNCDFNHPAQAEDTVSKFLNDFLGPDAPVIVRNTADTNAIQLVFNPELTKSLKETIPNDGSGPILAPSGNAEVDSAFSAIISQSSQVVTIRPQCVFEPGEVDNNKLAQWIAELNATGV